MGSGGTEWETEDVMTVARLNQKNIFIGASEPATMYAGMIWIDTTNNLFKRRNSTNDAWFILNSSIDLQGLYGLYHLNEGTGTAAKDSTPATTAHDGTITIGTGSWAASAIAGKTVLTFNADGNVNIGGSFDIDGTDTFAVNIKVNLTEHYADGNYLFYRVNQFYLQHYTTDDKIRFAVRDSAGDWTTLTTDASVAPLNTDLTITGVYDGAKIYIYINGLLITSTAMTGNVYSDSGDITIATSLKGVVSEASLWTRSISLQEVAELYFFPLNRIVRKTSGGPTTDWYLGIDADYHYGTTTPDSVQVIGSGEDIEVTATPVNSDYSFIKWIFDGEDYSTDNPVTIPAQTDATYHVLLAVFNGPFSSFKPMDCSITTVDSVDILTPTITAGISSVDSISIYTYTKSPSIDTVESISTLDTYKWFLSIPSVNVGSFDIDFGLTYYDANPATWATDYYVTGVGAVTSGYVIQNLHPSATTAPSSVGEAFNGDGGNLYGCGFFLKKVGSPVGTLVATIYATTGTYGSSARPTGAVLKTSTDSLAMADVRSDVYTWYYFTFDGAQTMTNGTKYCIQLECSAKTTVDSSNYVIVSSGSFGFAGNITRYLSNAWSYLPTNDINFVIFRSTIAAGEGVTVTSTPNTAAGYVLPTSNPIVFDKTLNVGTYAVDYLTASFIIPEQLKDTTHFISGNYTYGWGIIKTGTTSNGYAAVASGSNLALSRTGTNTYWYLDGVWVYTGTSYIVLAQTNGTVHTIECNTTPP